jgi:ankyrin repeat protein
MISPMKGQQTDASIQFPDIIIAAYESRYDDVRRLLAMGVDVNSVDARDNLSILHIACLQGDLTLAQIILDHDKSHGNVDFSIRSLYRPRLAWQYAMNGNFTELAEIVHAAGLAKLKRPRSLTP